MRLRGVDIANGGHLDARAGRNLAQIIAALVAGADGCHAQLAVEIQLRAAALRRERMHDRSDCRCLSKKFVAVNLASQ